MKKIIPIITVCVILIIGVLIYFERNFEHQRPEKINKAKVAMVKYFSYRGLKDGDYTLYINYRLDSRLLGYSGYVIKVIYKDEPNVTYGYDYFTNGEIINRSANDNNNGNNKNFKHEN